MGRLNRFPHLTQQREFDRVYKGADKVWHTPWFVLFFRKSSECGVAFVAGKKVGNAVKRNRAKRRLRALFADRISHYRPGAYILVAKPPIVEADYGELETAWTKALERSGALRKPRNSFRQVRPS
ncbi:ribonuclease P protein component [Nitratifractor sp.]|uniref:ribonuclease P protein component n=1 Tax=Nitratifractor sp. TaxID=2268144 RepID=UPI002600E502|nr:ribonuclease P protein component [Nitratifractor sp.]